jgi:hypothetical protein
LNLETACVDLLCGEKLIVRKSPLASIKPGRRLLKLWAWFAVLGILGIVLLLGLVWLDHNQDTTLPALTGVFAVGRTTWVWIDPAHSAPMAPPHCRINAAVRPTWNPHLLRSGESSPAHIDPFPETCDLA